jgi:3-dehydroquinate synthase
MEVYLLTSKKELAPLIDSLYPGRNVFYVVDSKVKLFHPEIGDAMNSFPMFAGERAKSIVGVMDIQNQLLNLEEKSPVVVAIGGGSVLDVCGFALATFAKKLKVVFAPTTFSAQLEGFFKDESYVNFDRVKDIMKVRFHPDELVAVPEFFKTQKFEERKSAFIHAIALGVSHSERFFNATLKILNSNLFGNEEMIKYLLFENLRTRANVNPGMVGEESAKALMSASKLEMPYLVALQYGILIESFISTKLGFLSQESFEKVYRAVSLCARGHFDLSGAVETLSYSEEPLTAHLPVKIGSMMEYKIFPGFLSEMIYSAHSQGYL